MSVDLKFTSLSKASRKTTTNDSQYFTVFLQAVLNYRALLRTEYTASKKINRAHPKSAAGAVITACCQHCSHQILAHMPQVASHVTHGSPGSKISLTKQSVCPKKGTTVLPEGLPVLLQLPIAGWMCTAAPASLSSTTCCNQRALAFPRMVFLLFPARKK